MTAWGYDCSGLTSTVFGVLGVTLPRDAADQSLAGRAVARRNLRPGDLVFFSHTPQRGDIHHVAIYAGHGRLLQSPYTGSRVQLVSLRHSYLNREYWGPAVRCRQRLSSEPVARADRAGPSFPRADRQGRFAEHPAFGRRRSPERDVDPREQPPPKPM